LPGIAEEKGSRRKAASADVDEKMKIAWRYERLGQAGERGALLAFTIAAYMHRSISLDRLDLKPFSS